MYEARSTLNQAFEFRNNQSLTFLSILKTARVIHLRQHDATLLLSVPTFSILPCTKHDADAVASGYYLVDAT
jgi:hypothetical protein